MSDFPTVKNFDLLRQYCEILSSSPCYSQMGGMAGIMAVIMTAQELDIGPMAALNGALHLIPTVDKNTNRIKSAQICMSYDMILAKIRKAGHMIQEIENSNEKIILKGIRCDTKEELTVSMTLQQARIAQLTHYPDGKPKTSSAWYKDPEGMLWKSCIRKLAKRLFSDVINAISSPDDIDQNQDDEEENAKNIIMPFKEQEKSFEIIEIEENKLLIEDQCELHLKLFKEKYDLENENSNAYMFLKSTSEKSKKNMDWMIEYSMKNEEYFKNQMNEWVKTEKTL